MSGDAHRPEPPRAALAWVRLLLRAFPGRFRQRFAESMEDSFREQWQTARARGRAAVCGLLARGTVDLLRAGLAERWAAAPGRDGVVAIFGHELRLALRALLRRPGFTAVAVTTLALGMGANAAIFSVVNGVLLRPLPWPDQDRLVTIWAVDEQDPANRGAMSRPDLLDVEGTDAFAVAVGYSVGANALTGLGEAEAIQVARVTSGMLAVFGLHPVLGRDLTLADTESGATEVVVLSHGFWLGRMSGDPDVVGRTLELRGRPHRIVGVAPAGFAYPSGVQMWRPDPHQPEGCARGCHTLSAIGRLADGVGLAAARAEVGALAERLQDAYPDTNFQNLFDLVGLEDHTVGEVRQGLWMLLGAVGLVLLIACANVANLLLARGQTRHGEVAVRSALGASGGRLAAGALLEALVLSALGGGAGLAVAYGGVELLRRVGAGTIPRIEEVALDGAVLLFALGLVVVVTLVFGLAPAVRLARSTPASGLAAAGRGRSGSAADTRSRGVLVAAEVALSLMLLVGAGLLLKSFARVWAIDPGYETQRVVRFTLSLPAARYPSDDLPATVRFFRELEDRLAARPGVEGVGSVYGAPLGLANIVAEVEVEGRPAAAPGRETHGSLKSVTPGYLAAMRMPVLRGRGIEPSDDAAAPPVALVSETLVRETFPNEDPIGKRFHVTASFGYADPTWTIVGVVGDVKGRSLTGAPAPEVYVPHAQFGPGFMTVVARQAPGAPPLAPAIRDEVRALDAAVPIQALESMEEVIARELAVPRFYLTLVALFAALAALLAAVGLYGVVSFLVSRRTREIGVRVALGARRTTIVALVLGQGLRPALWGVAIGLVGAWAASRALEALLFEVQATDPVVYAGVAALLLVIVAAACLVPARSAARLDPVRALRAE